MHDLSHWECKKTQQKCISPYRNQIPNHILTQVNNKMSLAFFPFFAFSLCTSFSNVKYCYSYMKHAPSLTKEKETRYNGLVKQQELSSFILRFRYSGSTRPNLPWSLRVACPSRLARSCVLSFSTLFLLASQCKELLWLAGIEKLSTSSQLNIPIKNKVSQMGVSAVLLRAWSWNNNSGA